MNDLWKKELLRTAALTFEELCFLFPDRELSNERPNESIDVTVQVEFWGPFNGALILRISQVMLPLIAANMLGQAEPPPEDQQWDALGEIANVICGNLLPRIAGVQETFQLSVPKVVAPGNLDDLAGDALLAVVRLRFVEGRAEVLLYSNSVDSTVVEGLQQ